MRGSAKGEHGAMDTRPDEVIESGPVTLRRYREDDLDALLATVTESAGHLRPWMPWAENISRPAQAEFLAQAAQDWADGMAYNYAIWAGPVLAGGISLMARIGPGGLEIGYWVRQACTRRDAAPYAVPDPQFPLDHQMQDVVRQPGPGRSAVQPVHHPIVPFHQRVGALVVG